MIRIISDSTCDLSPELLERYDVTILPLHILMGEKEYEDGIGITPDEIYAWSDQTGQVPKTSAPSIDSAIKVMKPYLDQGDELICFCISESMSTSGNVMRLTAEELDAEDRVTVINSKNLSTGIGLLIVEAAIMAKEGKTAEEIRTRIEDLIPEVRTSFVVDTMVYLHRGGRCGSVAALAGSALKLHPEIIVEDGAMHVGKKFRGKMDKVIEKYAGSLKDDLLSAKKDRVFVTHSGCSEELVSKIKGYVEELQVFDEVLVTRAGGVISTHCGPGTLGVLFIADE
ncbi:MAG: DegV family protein [Eubacterium sp.]|nr:DegV family protein [Eubacterium sp.]